MNSWLSHLDGQLRAEIPQLPLPERDEKALSALQKVVKQPLPPVFREFMLWKPTGLQIAFQWELLDCVGGFLLEPAEMELVMAEWKAPSPVGTRHWWNASWIPLWGTSGDFLCLDLPGTFKNQPGSLLSFDHDRPARPVSFPNFEGWLRWVGMALEQGMGRAFLQEGKLDIVLGRKAIKLHRDLFANYPQKYCAEILGIGLLDQVLNLIRNHGLQVKCPLPAGLSQDQLAGLLTDSFVRDDGGDGQAVRVIVSQPDGTTLYTNLRPGDQAAELEAIVALPGNAAQAIRNAKALQEQSQNVPASSRFSEAAFTCFQSGLAAEASVLLRRALQLHPENTVASRSLTALEARQVKVDPQVIRPLLQHIYAS
ncbi:SMI1/KNR4 family protein [bacterium]|nr:SMI1/KNR4 family protein [bacterium]